MDKGQTYKKTRTTNRKILSHKVVYFFFRFLQFFSFFDFLKVFSEGYKHLKCTDYDMSSVKPLEF